MRRSRVWALFGGLVLLAAACGGGDSNTTVDPNAAEDAATTTTSSSSASTTTIPPTTTTTVPKLTPAQEIYCEDLVTDVMVPTSYGGSQNRPETVVFFELAGRLGYLDLPYLGEDWGQGVAHDADQFVSNVVIFEGSLFSDDNLDAFITEWKRNLQEAGVGVLYLLFRLRVQNPTGPSISSKFL